MKRRKPIFHILFANEAEAEALVEFANDLAVGADGWAQLAPYGDYPGKATLVNDTQRRQFPAVQRLDKAAAELMVENFHRPLQKLKRFFTGCPIYVGHPDVATIAHKYPDREAKGMIVDLAAREDGLYCKPVFTNEGSQLVESRQLRAFSGVWTAVPVGQVTQDGRAAIYRPDILRSAGLTNQPNLPVQFLNEKQKETNEMNKKLIIPILALHGLTLAETASDEDFAAALNQVSDRAKNAVTLANEKQGVETRLQTATTQVSAKDTEIATLKSERDQARTLFSNERQTRITGILDTAITSGKITAAERPDWERRLKDEAQFANEAEAITKLTPKVKTIGVTDRTGERKVEIANASQRADTVRDLVNTEMQANGGDYDAAFSKVRKNNPALFEAMAQPKLTS